MRGVIAQQRRWDLTLGFYAGVAFSVLMFTAAILITGTLSVA